MTAPRTAVDDQLRAWARGLYTTEAATELLIRAHHGAFAHPSRPWIFRGTTGAGSTSHPSQTISMRCQVANNDCCGSPPPSDPATR